MTTDQSVDVSPDRSERTPTSTIDIVALVLAVLAAPVGLVLAIVAIRRAKRQQHAPSVLAVIASVVGSIFTLLLVGVIVLVSFVLNSLEDQRRVDAFCERFGQDAIVLDDIQGLQQEMANAGVDPKGIGESSLSESDRLRFAEQISELTGRVNNVSLNEGRGFVAIWFQWVALSDELTSVESTLERSSIDMSALRSEEHFLLNEAAEHAGSLTSDTMEFCS